MKNLLINTVVTFFGAGYLKPFSATWGSLASGIVLYFFWPEIGWEIKMLIIIGTFLLGWFCSTQVEKRDHSHDPSMIVIDEVVGMMIVTFFLEAIWFHWLLAFFLFRFFDIAKVWPASWFDKRRGGFSIMFDDVLMALAALTVVSLFT